MEMKESMPPGNADTFVKKKVETEKFIVSLTTKSRRYRFMILWMDVEAYE